VHVLARQLEQLGDLVRRLAEVGRDRALSELATTLIARLSEVSDSLQRLEHLENEVDTLATSIQDEAIGMRLLPVGPLLESAGRPIRDLASEQGKQVHVVVEAGNVVLDRKIIESLPDALIHLSRNAVDHGIELPEERTAKGKRAKGLLSIRAYNEGNHVIIEVYDDGKGINIQAVKDKVKEKGLMNDAELASLSPKEAMNLIFIPGLSTAQKISKVSGRGVGMDVVRTNIEKMNGQAHIDSEEGKWTKLTIKLPLTLAIMRALIVKVTEELFAIPLNTVTELVKLKEGLIKTVDKNEVLVLRNTVIPIVDLSKAFLMQGSEDGSGYVVICSLGEKTIGIKVNSVIGQEEVVIKPLGKMLQGTPGMSGATITGDGRIALILDVPSMLKRYAARRI
jgi:two-component system chemotaxis sensor kinase CheA